MWMRPVPLTPHELVDPDGAHAGPLRPGPMVALTGSAGKDATAALVGRSAPGPSGGRREGLGARTRQRGSRRQQGQQAGGPGGHARDATARGPDRILDRGGEDGGDRQRAGLPYALETERVERRERLEMVDGHGRHVGGGGQEIVHVAAGEELAGLVVGDLL